jgi:vesicle-fusing ATPase
MWSWLSKKGEDEEKPTTEAAATSSTEIMPKHSIHPLTNNSSSSNFAVTRSNMQRNSFFSAKLHNPELSYTNKIYFNKADIDPKVTPYVKVAKQDGRKDVYLFAADVDGGVQPGRVTFSLHQRRWTEISLEREIHVFPFPDSAKQYIVGMNVTVDYIVPPKETMGPIDTDKMAPEFSMNFSATAFAVGQQVVFKFKINDKDIGFVADIKEISIMSRDGKTTEKASFGILSPNAAVIFDKNPESMISLIGKSKGKSVQRALINPEWDFQKIGIGGLDKEFADIFRRAFASRVFPPEYSEQLGIKHVRGILLYGPPGTGKTLIARQIGKMLNAREPKIVNGPEILNKYVGESEANMRKLFADAEEEYKRCGANSGLHMIIFDEIDAICKQRGSQAGSTGVHDTMVNQLLTKLDGVEQLNNILVIGMTNRRDMIDEALLRPGRMEVQLEISLPDEKGRVQILKIHTARMQEFKYLNDDVDIAEIARRTKNFSGAEIEGLVRAAQSSAMNRLIKVGSKVEIDEDAVDKLKITMDDFEYAMEHDIKPAFGTADDVLEAFLRHGLVNWGPEVDEILKTGQLLARETTNEENPGFTKAIFTGAPNTGKTYLAARIAKDADFPFIKVCTPQKMIGFSETAKCQIINRMFNDAYKSPLSILIIDDLERLMDYTPIGPRFSNLVLQALLVLLNSEPPKGHRLLVLATSSSVEFLQDVDLLSRFPKVVRIRQLRHLDEMISVCEEANLFGDDELRWIKQELGKIENLPPLGIKSLLHILAFVRASDERAKTFVSQIEELSLGL